MLNTKLNAHPGFTPATLAPLKGDATRTGILRHESDTFWGGKGRSSLHHRIYDLNFISIIKKNSTDDKTHNYLPETPQNPAGIY